MIFVRPGFVGAMLALCLLPTLGQGQDLAGIFRPWDGEWRGEFVIYTAEGEEKTTLEVLHRYRSRNDVFQSAEIVDTFPDGRAVTKTAHNVVEKGTLLCRVFRADGTLEVEHQGTLRDGYLFWRSYDEKGRLRQLFRERVQNDTYTVDGFGIYGPERDVIEVYVGRYRRIR